MSEKGKKKCQLLFSQGDVIKHCEKQFRIQRYSVYCHRNQKKITFEKETREFGHAGLFAS